MRKLNSRFFSSSRGSATSTYVGNVRFRAIVEEHKPAYRAAPRNKVKTEVAEVVFKEIRSLGGRFLRLGESAEPIEFVIEEGTWYEEDKDVSLEKIKQALRQKKRDKPSDGESDVARDQNGATQLPTGMTPSTVPLASFSTLASSLALPKASTDFSPVLSVPVAGNSVESYGIDPRLMLFHTSPFLLSSSQIEYAIQNLNLAMAASQAQLTAGTLPSELTPDLYLSGNPPGAVFAQQPPPENTVHSQSRKSSISGVKHSISPRNVEANPNANPQGELSLKSEHKDGDSADKESGSAQKDQETTSGEEDIPEYLLSMLSLSGRTTISEEQAALEAATMADSEKADALADLFGQMHSVDNREYKRPRRDLDRKSIDFLIRHMQAEIEAIPLVQKQALIEAQSKGRPEEFRDERLEMFLRCEGMNAKVRIKFRFYVFNSE